MNVNKDDILAFLRNEISTILKIKQETIKPHDTLESLGIDSISLVSIFVSIESEYNIKLLEANINNEDLYSLDTLAEKIYNLLLKH